MITIRNSLAREVVDYLNSRFSVGTIGAPRISFYQGVRPAYPEINHAATLLATFALPNDVFLDAVSEAGQARAVADVANIEEATISTSGQAQWWRAYNRDGLALLDGSVTNNSGNGDAKILDTNLIQGRKLKILTWNVILPQ